MEIRAVGNCLSRVLVGGSLVVAGAGCAAGGEAQAVAAGTDGAEWRGSVVSVTPVVRMSRTDVPRYLEKEDPRLGSPQASRGINGFRVLYRTISPSGRPIVASGVVALPRDGAKVLRAVSFTHGTQVWRDTAGSVAADGQGRIAAIYYAAAGYAGVAPDYLGLGMGEGKHPTWTPHRKRPPPWTCSAPPARSRAGRDGDWSGESW